MSLRDTWFMADTLLALARNLAAAQCFSKVDLMKWCPSLAVRRTSAHTALEHLRVLDFIRFTSPEGSKPHLGRGYYYYKLTPEGVDAAKAAQAEARRQGRATTALKMSEHTRASSEFAARLWSLVRMRQSLTALDAAELLTDAGGDIAQAKAAAARYLRTWARAFPEALQVSAKRIDGFNRYVLLKDLGPGVPAVAIGAVAAKKGVAV